MLKVYIRLLILCFFPYQNTCIYIFFAVTRKGKDHYTVLRTETCTSIMSYLKMSVLYSFCHCASEIKFWVDFIYVFLFTYTSIYCAWRERTGREDIVTIKWLQYCLIVCLSFCMHSIMFSWSTLYRTIFFFLSSMARGLVMMSKGRRKARNREYKKKLSAVCVVQRTWLLRVHGPPTRQSYPADSFHQKKMSVNSGVYYCYPILFSRFFVVQTSYHICTVKSFPRL